MYVHIAIAIHLNSSSSLNWFTELELANFLLVFSQYDTLWIVVLQAKLCMQKIVCPLRIHCTEDFVPSFSIKVVLGTLAALFTTVFLRGNSEYQLVDIFHIIPRALCGLFQTWVIQSVVKLRYYSYLTTHILTTQAHGCSRRNDIMKCLKIGTIWL